MNTTTNAAPAAPRAYSYIRFSTPDQAAGDSQRRQSQLAADYCNRHGLTLDTELSLNDFGVSGFRGANAKKGGALGAFLDAIEDKVVLPGSLLLVENLDRLSRQNPRKAAALLGDIVDAGVDVVTLAGEPKRYSKATLDNGFDFLWIVIVFIRANDESATKSRRNKAAWVGLRESGKVMTALTPGWIRKVGERLELIPEHAAVVQRIFQMYVEGAGCQRIASTLNREKVPTFGTPRKGGAAVWHQSYIRLILSNRAVLGEFIPHIEETADDGVVTRVPQPVRENYYPRCIDDELWTRAQAMKESKAPARMQSAQPAVSILAGLARCPVCGGVMTRVFKGSKAQPVARLVCSAVKSRSAHAYVSIPLDIITTAIRRLASMPFPSKVENLEDDLRGAQAGLEETVIEVESTLVSLKAAPKSKALLRQLAAQEAALERAKAAVADLERQAAETDTLLLKRRHERLTDVLSAEPFDPGKANAALRECLKSVLVNHETGELVLSWRHDGETVLRYDYSAEFEDFTKAGAP